MSGSQSPQYVAGERLITQLTSAISGYTSNFCCGGSIRVINSSSTTRYGDFTRQKDPINSPPIDIRWDAPGSEISRKITFPVRQNEEQSLQQLVKDCQPATFGFDGKNVLDETIRKAGKLDASMFSTSFNPYDFGIVDTIARMLMPGIIWPGSKSAERWGIVAELYKLNVYSEPSGQFKPHVDTPRGYTQFGSLVVCLPSPHEGGELRVAHNTVKRGFDLGSRRPYSYDTSIHWAAFYSDCEHEVLPVTSGHRVTLTYQLYVSEHLGGLMHPQFSKADSELWRLYQSIKEMYLSPAFMNSGGVLGFHCVHQYPDTVDGTWWYERRPRCLKGIDAVLFTIFRAIGLIVHFKSTPKEWLSGTASRFQGLLSDGEEIEIDIPRFHDSDEVFNYVKWFNKRADDEAERAYHEVARPVQQWIGNESELDWWYSSMALLVVIPAYSKRESSWMPSKGATTAVN